MDQLLVVSLFIFSSDVPRSASSHSEEMEGTAMSSKSVQVLDKMMEVESDQVNEGDKYGLGVGRYVKDRYIGEDVR